MTTHTDTEALIAELDRAIDTCDLMDAWNLMDRAKKALRQERERADEATAAAEDHVLDAEAVYERMRLKLSRAEETIEKAIACEEHTHRIMTDRKPTREDSSLTWRILTDYDQQKEAHHD